MPFADRRSAGTELARVVADLRPTAPIVLGLPRGGVPVAYEVARRLDCPLDVLVVRKIGLPYQRELAMGSVGEGGIVIRNEDVIDLVGVDEKAFNRALESEQRELEARLRQYRAEAPAIEVESLTAIVVDDGLATGSTALAAVEVLRARKAGSVWVAVPVAPRDTAAKVRQVADEVVILEAPRRFGAVGAWYRDFSQTRDSEVRSLLAQSRLR